LTSNSDEQSHPPGWLGRAEKGFDFVVTAGAALAAILLVTMMLATVTKVVFRYGLNEGLIGVDQLSGTMMLYITFLGAAWVLRREEHVTIDLLMNALSPNIKLKLNVVASIIGALICFTIVVFGTMETIGSWQRDVLIPAEIEYPRAINIAVIPLGCLCLGMQFLRRARSFWRNEILLRNTPRMEA